MNVYCSLSIYSNKKLLYDCYSVEYRELLTVTMAKLGIATPLVLWCEATRGCRSDMAVGQTWLIAPSD